MDVTELSPTLTIEECASVLGLSRGSAYEAARVGQIPVLRIGRRLLVPRAKLLQMLGEDRATPEERAVQDEEMRVM